MFQADEPQESVPGDKKEYDLTNRIERLSKSDFRSRCHLSKQDREYVMEKGLPTIRKHAEDFVAKRLAPAVIPNDGKQTPMHGHPVFLAQHATGCCCRGCFFTTDQIADAINRHGLHLRKDGQPVTSKQVYATICRFPEMFTKEAGRIMLMI